MPKDAMRAPNPERMKQLRTKAIDHLEAAVACVDETQDGAGGYLIQCALDELRSRALPALDPPDPLRPPPRA
jgi:hypothetical protein